MLASVQLNGLANRTVIGSLSVIATEILVDPIGRGIFPALGIERGLFHVSHLLHALPHVFLALENALHLSLHLLHSALQQIIFTLPVF